MIEAAIFDMDGILLDSEPFWQDAEMEVFASVGIKLTREQCIETTGLPVIDVVACRFKQCPWKKKSIEETTAEIISGVEERVRSKAVPLEGVTEVIKFFSSRRIPVAVASSSAMRLISTVLKKLSLESTFNIVHSAENEEYGKPHPSVFLTTARLLNIKPAQCLVFEDSFNGLIAAKAARMKTVAVPMESQWDESRFDIADVKLRSLKDFSELQWSWLNTLP